MSGWSPSRARRLACTVRGCGRPLGLVARALVCESGHSFDLARSGYANLLQPQDRRSKTPGDAPSSLDARARLHRRGIAAPLLDELAGTLAALAPERPPAVLDAGCGEGQMLAALASRRALEGYGVDLSTRAIEAAARAHPELVWLVANADRRLPILDGTMDLVLSIAGPKNPAEFARVLAPEGRLAVAVPGADDLIELRGCLSGDARAIERASPAIEAFAESFVLASRSSVRSRLRLAPAELRDALASAYRAGRERERSRAEGLEEMDVTFAWEVLVFRRRA